MKNCLSGRHGGLVACVDAIADAMREDAVTNYVESVFLGAMNPMDFNFCVRLMEEYVKIYGHVLLAGEELLSPAELAGNLQIVIQNHVRLLNDWRKTLQ